jgi:hypothetical protein
MSVEDQRQEVQRILHSPHFRRAPKLQRFLELICDYHFQNRSAEINEFVIATEAFGKGSGFDPSGDSLVRVQAREIRRRLREYYQDEGASSRLHLDIPVGSYAPMFTSPIFTAHEAPPPGRRAPSIRAAWLILAGTVLACAAILIAADHERRLLVRSTASAAERVNAAALSPPIVGLWKRFLDSDVPTVLVVSNPDVGGCTEQKNGAAGCPDEYTGMGEAVGIHLITTLFRSAKQTLMVEQSRFVNPDDIKRYNLILLGGKGVNIWTRRLGEDLSLTDPNQPEQYQTAIDSRTGLVTRDRAIVALRKHPASGRWVLFLWGRHSQGTRAAAEAATDERFLARLQWPAPGAAFPDTFHVLVSVNVNDGIPEGPVPVAVRIP